MSLLPNSKLDLQVIVSESIPSPLRSIVTLEEVVGMRDTLVKVDSFLKKESMPDVAFKIVSTINEVEWCTTIVNDTVHLTTSKSPHLLIVISERQILPEEKSIHRTGVMVVDIDILVDVPNGIPDTPQGYGYSILNENWENRIIQIRYEM